MEKKKLVFISNMASPYQVKFCYALQEYFDAEFWFYVQLEANRPAWWQVPLGEKCKVMDYSGQVLDNYFSFGLFKDLNRFKPDIILLGGFMSWHWLVMRWAKMYGAKVGIMSEILRIADGDGDASNTLMSRENSNTKIKAISTIFRGADLYLGMGESACKQFREEFYFPKHKVDKLEYPSDIDDYYNHPLREKSVEDEFVILFANRLIDRYQPLYALEVFYELSKTYENIKMKLNSDGPLREKCEEYIAEKNLKNVSFLNAIESWEDMGNIYRDSDILVLPATYSNGNLSIMESCASGMGVVVSDNIYNMTNEIINNENCFIVSLDKEEFISAIEKYLNNPKLLIEHGLRSRELLEHKRNKHTAKRYYELFEKHNFV